MSGRPETKDAGASGARALSLSFLVIAALGGEITRAEVTFSPALSANALWIDNVTFAAQNEPQQGDEMLQLTPSLRVAQRGDRFNSLLKYDLNAERFVNDKGLNQTYHELDARSEATLLLNSLYLGGYVTYSQVLTNPTTPQSLGGVVPIGNLANVLTYGARPRFEKQFKDTTVAAMYTVAKVDYRSVFATGLPTPNATVSMLQSSWSTNDDSMNRLTYAVTYDSQKASYQTNVYPDFRFDTARLELGWRIVPQFSVFGSGGGETDLTKNISKGGLDVAMYEGGIRWRPSKEALLELAAGDQSYGRTYRGKAAYIGRVLSLNFTYTDQATTISNQLGLLPGVSTTGIPSLSLGYSPGALGSAATPLAASQGFQRVNGDVFVGKDFDGTLTLTGRRTEISATAFSHVREYLTSTNSDHQSGGMVAVKRKLTPRMTGTLEVTKDVLSLQGTSSYDEIDERAILERQLTTNSSVGLQVAHMRRTGVLSRYDATWAMLGYQLKFK
jgi:uncharacterized protein (PEP-CTERM system associated)